MTRHPNYEAYMECRDNCNKRYPTDPWKCVECWKKCAKKHLT